jgi:hypothetical protein
VALLLLGLYALFLYAFSGSSTYGSIPDGPVYLLMASYFSPWGGAAEPVERFAMQTSMFPPLYPLLLGFGGGGSSVAVAHALTASCLLAALLAGRRWLLAAGLGRGPALALLAAFALVPATLLQALETLSENLYLALSLLHLGELARAEAAQGRSRRRALLFAAGSAGLALLTRSAGVALVGGFGLWLALRREPGRLRLLALALAPFALWTLAKPALGFAGSYADAFSSRLASYAAQPVPAFALAIGAQLEAMARAWPGLFALFASPLERALAMGFGLLALLGLARRLRRGKADALYAALGLLLILLWPFPAHTQRFLYPLLPVLLFQALEGFDLLVGRLARAPLARARGALLAGALLLPLASDVHIARRFADSRGLDPEQFAYSARWYTRRSLERARQDARFEGQLAHAMRDVAPHVPRDACIFSLRPLELMLYARRPSQLPPPEVASDAAFAEGTRACDWFLLAPLAVPPYRTPYYPLDRMGAELEITVAFGEAPGGGLPVAALARRRARGALDAAPRTAPVH